MIKTIAENSSGSVKIQRSEFIAFLYPVKDTEQVKSILAVHNEKYKDASHNCYAYVLGKKQETQYYSDQGEPGGTAGKPILNALLRHKLTNVLAIVTRYFGGVKLGVRGLIDAYSQSMEELIKLSELTDFRPTSEISFHCSYHILENLKHLMYKHSAEIITDEFSDIVKGRIIYPLDKAKEINALIMDLTNRQLLTIINSE